MIAWHSFLLVANYYLALLNLYSVYRDPAFVLAWVALVLCLLAVPIELHQLGHLAARRASPGGRR